MHLFAKVDKIKLAHIPVEGAPKGSVAREYAHMAMVGQPKGMLLVSG